METMPVPASSPRRAVLVRIAVVLAAVVLGLVLQDLLGTQLERIQARSQTDMLGARAELARIFEIASVVVFGLTGALGVVIVVGCRRSLATLEFPPSGLLSWGARRAVVTGARARNFAVMGIALGVTLVLASAAGGGLLWYMAQVLRACRAGTQVT